MPEDEFVGFPDLDDQDEVQPTRPMPLHERPRQFRIDHEMEIVRKHHERIANSIELFWGHRDCVEYLQKLVFSGADNSGKARVGFKPEVLTALMNLEALHAIL
ncbi:MAG: hypothetical protein KBF98_03325 [Rhodoferax sp.]|mgnify:CR=1 FL=1|jgi:hypothetical protein|nr:hypothetical protein [Rhodoferax sp.]MBP9059330.1 hypothetical protein [Rhodoferax sp.]MBP9683499.1 hypothetical protein [Rhodoferax sp.]